MGPACTYVYSLANNNVRNKWLQNKLATREEMKNALQIWIFLTMLLSNILRRHSNEWFGKCVVCDFKVVPTNTMGEGEAIWMLKAFLIKAFWIKQKYINKKSCTKIKGKSELQKCLWKMIGREQKETTITLLLFPKASQKIYLRHWMPTILKAKHTGSWKIKYPCDFHRWPDRRRIWDWIWDYIEPWGRNCCSLSWVL